MQVNCDFLVIGSGATGAIAAKTLVDQGKLVTMVDVGVENSYKDSIGSRNFVDIRTKDPAQSDTFLGRHFEGIGWQNTKVGAQLTPPRMYLTKDTERLTPFTSAFLQPMESLAKGGLGGGWGAGCFVFSSGELQKIGLEASHLTPSYQYVADHIGISGCFDDGAKFALGELKNILPPQKLEMKMQRLYANYAKRHKRLNQKGLYLGKLPLALLTKDFNSRKATAYNDMDFYADDDRSAYRSWITIEELQGRTNFNYHQQLLAIDFVEQTDGSVVVNTINTLSFERVAFHCKTLVLAAGVLGTSRIVARSLAFENKRLPFICNPYAYTACIQPRFLGSVPDKQRSSFGQLAMYIDPSQEHQNVSLAVLFSYGSLLLNKLMKEIPHNFSDGRALVQFLHTGLTIAGIHFPDEHSDHKYIELVADAHSITGDKLIGNYALSSSETLRNQHLLKTIHNGLKQIGCWPLKTVHLPAGASIHYAGTLPFAGAKAPIGTLQTNGLLNGTKRVFVADGCGFRFLPAKGLTLTLMANAHHVANSALKTHS